MTLKQDVVIEELARVARANSGILRPEDVVNEARAPESPLHSYFEWRNAAAAHEYRLHQARQLIRSVKIHYTVEDFKVEVPIYVRDPRLPTHTQGYATIGRIRTDTDASRDLLLAEFQRASSALTRAKNIARVLGASETDIADIVARINDLSAVFQESP